MNTSENPNLELDPSVVTTAPPTGPTHPLPPAVGPRTGERTGPYARPGIGIWAVIWTCRVRVLANQVLAVGFKSSIPVNKGSSTTAST